MDKYLFEQMLHHFDAEKIEEKEWDYESDMWCRGKVLATEPYYKYCNSQWRSRVHRQIEYDTFKILKEFRKLKNENIRLLDEQSAMQKRCARLTNCNQKQASVIRKLKN